MSKIPVEDDLVDISDVAARLDADEKLKLTYRFPVSNADGRVDYETREGRLLDISQDANLLYVAHSDAVIWVRLEEAISVSPDL
ncbi:MAG: hypothetical protein ABFD54_17110 [Armatimonadota bacterium]